MTVTRLKLIETKQKSPSYHWNIMENGYWIMDNGFDNWNIVFSIMITDDL